MLANKRLERGEFTHVVCEGVFLAVGDPPRGRVPPLENPCRERASRSRDPTRPEPLDSCIICGDQVANEMKPHIRQTNLGDWPDAPDATHR